MRPVMQKWLCSLVSIVLLAACGGPVVSGTLNRYHQEPLEVTGKSYVFLPTPEQSASLEYQKYAAQFAGELALMSMYQRAAPPADFGVEIAYGVNEGPTPAGIGGSAGYGYTLGSAPVPATGPDGKPLPPALPTEGGLVYTRQIEMRLIDLTAPARLVKFEGKIASSGWRRELVSVSGCIIPAFFDDFPGEHGETIKFAAPSGKCIGDDAEKPVPIDQ